MVDHAAALSLRERVRPVSLAGERVLAASGPLASLLPDGGLRRGTTVATGGVGGTATGGVGGTATGGVGIATSVALAVTAAVATAGSWVAAVGLGRLGLAAAEEYGVCLERLLLVDPVPAQQWAPVVAALVEAVDVVLVGPPSSSVPAAQARRVVARLRERGAVLVQVGWPERAWPDRPELVLQARPLAWSGIGEGYGYLQARLVEIVVGGRRGADRGGVGRYWLPDDQGRLAVADPAVVAGPAGTAGLPAAVGGLSAGDRAHLSLVPQ